MSIAGNEIQKMWRIFPVGESSILELRALPPKGMKPKKYPVAKHFRAANFENVDASKRAVEKDALRLNALGYNVYIVMNPIRADFSGTSAGDDDIAYRALILIDLDRAGKKTDPATDVEIEAARLVANNIKGYMSERGFSDPLRVMSGNGHHLYYELKDVPNTNETTVQVQQLLRNLAAKFDNDVVKVDTSVFNASRITKVPGTVMRKGVESEDRPFRMAVVYEE